MCDFEEQDNVGAQQNRMKRRWPRNTDQPDPVSQTAHATKRVAASGYGHGAKQAGNSRSGSSNSSTCTKGVSIFLSFALYGPARLRSRVCAPDTCMLSVAYAGVARKLFEEEINQDGTISSVIGLQVVVADF